jgi:hypothetical protein
LRTQLNPKSVELNINSELEKLVVLTVFTYFVKKKMALNCFTECCTHLAQGSVRALKADAST